MSTTSYQHKIEFVEDFSLKIEELGYPRIYGQILGWLLICDPAHQSFPDLMENLNISKASVSNVTRLLLERGLIEKVRIQGERQMYFKLRKGSLVDFMEKQLRLTHELEAVTAKALKFVEDKKEPKPERLTKMNHFYHFISKHIGELMQKYKEENNLD